MPTGSCVRLRATRPNHGWTYDFIVDRTSTPKAFHMVNIIEDFTRECPVIRKARRISAYDVLEQLVDLCILYGVPGFIRSDNGPGFVAYVVIQWLSRLGVGALRIEPGSTWEIGSANHSTSRRAMNCATGRCSRRCWKRTRFFSLPMAEGE